MLLAIWTGLAITTIMLSYGFLGLVGVLRTSASEQHAYDLVMLGALTSMGAFLGGISYSLTV